MQVFEIVRFLGRVKLIEIIRSLSSKTKAVVSFRENSCEERKLKEIWCLPFMNQILVRVIPGVNDYKILYTRSWYSRRLLELPANTNEVLLWRQIKKTGAKAIHIFKNSNDNKMSSATVYFEKEEDRVNSSNFSMHYYNSKLK